MAQTGPDLVHDATRAWTSAATTASSSTSPTRTRRRTRSPGTVKKVVFDLKPVDPRGRAGAARAPQPAGRDGGDPRVGDEQRVGGGIFDSSARFAPGPSRQSVGAPPPAPRPLPSISTSSEKLSTIRIRTIIPSTRDALERRVDAIVRTMSADDQHLEAEQDRPGRGSCAARAHESALRSGFLIRTSTTRNAPRPRRPGSSRRPLPRRGLRRRLCSRTPSRGNATREPSEPASIVDAIPRQIA